MKKLLIIMSLALGFQVFAGPDGEPLKTTMICRPYKRRKASKPIARTPKESITVTTEPQCINRTINEWNEPKKNRLSALMGFGPTSIKSSVTGSTTTYRVDRNALFGVSYERLVTDETSAGLVVLTNGSVLLKVGQDW